MVLITDQIDDLRLDGLALDNNGSFVVTELDDLSLDGPRWAATTAVRRLVL